MSRMSMLPRTLHISRGWRCHVVCNSAWCIGKSFPGATVESEVKELSADGGNIRLRTQYGELCKWEGYKAVCLHELAVAATCKDNPQLIEWVQRQPLAATVTCLGDGHDGIWNLIQPMLPDSQRREVLDWFHLMENRSHCRWVAQTTQPGANPALARQSG